MRLVSTTEGSKRPGLAVVALALVVAFRLSFGNFLSSDNLSAIGQASAFVLIGAIGTMALLVSGHVDLSIGSQYALITVSTALVCQHTGSTAVGLLAALGLGLVLGAVNGGLVLLLDVSPLIVTLGTLGVYGGLAYALHDGQDVVDLPAGMLSFGRYQIFGVPVTVVIAIATFAVVAFVLTQTVVGLRLYATGSDRRATALVGVRVRRIVLGVFTGNGLLIGLAAFLSTAQLASGSPQVGGVGYALNVLSATILGGVAFTGGRGHPLGVFAAVAAIGVLDAGLIFAGFEDWWQQVAQGALLLIALGADQLVVLQRERRVRRGQHHGRVSVPRAEPVAARRDRGDTGVRGVVLDTKDITVRFAGVVAIEQVSLQIRAGEVVCLVGDNGAGKSTLAKTICGAVRPAEGQIVLGDQVLTADPASARRAGVETVFQELALCPNLNVADNLALGQEPRTRMLGVLPVRDVATGEQVARTRLDELGIAMTNMRRPIRYLSGGERQIVQILRVMRPDVRLVVMDEPTSALALSQAGEVRALIKAIAASGTPVLLITHDVEEVFDVADRVVVLQRGKLVFDGSIESVSRIELLRMMSGKTRVQAAQILDAVSSERKRIERDLHDGAQQGLVTSALMLHMATERLRAREGEGDDIVKLLKESHSTLQSALAEMRAFSRGLQARVLERDGLVEAIQVLTDRAPVLVELRAGDVPRFDHAVERAAYFVIAESLTNSLKYADASRIVIELAVVEQELQVTIADDGVGFDLAGNGSGLQGLRDRAASAHGELIVHSVPGHGTTITGRFPAAQPAKLSRR